MRDATAWEEAAIRRAVIRRMAHLLELAYMSFDQRRFDRCIQLCEKVLLIDPHYLVARELKEDSERSRHTEENFILLVLKIEEWKKVTDDEQPVIPWSQTVRFPSLEMRWGGCGSSACEVVQAIGNERRRGDGILRGG